MATGGFWSRLVIGAAPYARMRRGDGLPPDGFLTNCAINRNGLQAPRDRGSGRSPFNGGERHAGPGERRSVVTVSRKNPLGGYLRSRRALVRPQDVGLPVSRSRRVPGL